MTEWIWYRHGETGDETLQPDTARPILANSGWFPVSDEDRADRERQALEEAAAADRAMQERAEAALSAAPEPDPLVAETAEGGSLADPPDPTVDPRPRTAKGSK